MTAIARRIDTAPQLPKQGWWAQRAARRPRQHASRAPQWQQPGETRAVVVSGSA